MLTGITADYMSWGYPSSFTNHYDGDRLIYRTGPGFEAWFDYDETGSPIAMTLSTNGTTSYYYFIKNLQGDILALADTTGTIVRTYSYDAWGRILSTVDATGIEVSYMNYSDPAYANPFRYRSYYYEQFSDKYWLQSRFYDPGTGRFINADGYVTTGQGVLSSNMFLYCENNPVNREDYSGFCYGYANNPNLDLPTSGVRYGYDCGSYGIHARRPRYVDITERLDEAMMQNSKELIEYNNQHGYVASVDYFIDKVKPGGEWDFKSQEDWNLEPDVTYVYNDTKLRYDDIGNIHYGYVGRVLFSETILLRAGGAVQIYAGNSKWEYYNSNFDDPRDQQAILFGSIIWDEGSLS